MMAMNKKRKAEPQEIRMNPAKKIKKSSDTKINNKSELNSKMKKLGKDFKPKEKKLITSKEFFDKKNNKPENVLKLKNRKHKIKTKFIVKMNESNDIENSGSTRNNENSKKNKKLVKGKAIEGQLDDKEFKDRKKIRKMRNSIFDIVTKCKSLWEDFRKFNLEKKRRSKIGDEIFELIKGKCLALMRAHDTSRVVQSMIKYGTQEQRNEIFIELEDTFINMAKSKYAKFCLQKFIKYSSKDHRNNIIEKLTFNVILLMRHKDASDVIEYTYNNFANASQRNGMIEQFYGPRYRLEKTENDKSLADFLSNHSDSKTFVLAFFKESLTSLIEKNILENTFIHKLFLDFLNNSSGAIREELIESMRDNFVHMLHTKEGARVTMLGIWHGTAKDRKAIIKSFKTYAVKICCEEYGHLVLLALFDSVDDTKIVQKIIIDEFIKSIDDIATNTYGRKVILYLLCPRNSENFHPSLVSILKQGDGNQHSKKDMSIRWDELTSYISNYLIDYVSSNFRRLITDNTNMLLAFNVLMYAKGDINKGLNALCDELCIKFVGSIGERGFHLIDNSAGHYLLKKLVQHDAKKMQLDDPYLFSLIVIDRVDADTFKSWLGCNRGCFFIISMLELKNSKVSGTIKTALSGCNKLLKKLNTPGSNILIKKLTEIV